MPTGSTQGKPDLIQRMVIPNAVRDLLFAYRIATANNRSLTAFGMTVPHRRR